MRRMRHVKQRQSQIEIILRLRTTSELQARTQPPVVGMMIVRPQFEGLLKSESGTSEFVVILLLNGVSQIKGCSGSQLDAFLVLQVFTNCALKLRHCLVAVDWIGGQRFSSDPN